jgi:hypothetical protein
MSAVTIGLVIGWILTIFIGVLAAMILVKIFTGDIDLNYIISDENGWASLSRFQFLIFTFVVAMSLFYLILTRTPPGYPEIPNQILALLGISGGSYVVSKGIQTSRDVGMAEAHNPPEVKDPKITNTPVVGDGGQVQSQSATQPSPRPVA